MRRFVPAVLAVAALAVPAAQGAAQPVQIRHVDFQSFPLVRVTAVAPVGMRPVLFENGRRATFSTARQLGSAEGLILAVDNSSSMRGRPLREAKAAARHFLAAGQRATTTGLVAFGHEALALTRSNESVEEVSRTLMQLAPDPQTGTSLYDAVVSSVTRLERMSTGTRILVLLTDGHDVGSHASLSRAVTVAQRAGVVVYPIAAGRRADRQTLALLGDETGGRLFDANDVSQLDAIYRALGRELDRTWQISYLTTARPGDAVTFRIQAGGAAAVAQVRVPGRSDADSGPLPASLARAGATGALFVIFAAALLAAAGWAVLRARRKSQVARLLQPHFRHREEKDLKREVSGSMEALTVWTESALADIPGSERLTRVVERSGVKVRPGHVPWIALLSAFVLAVLGTLIGAGPTGAILLMLIGLFVPFVFFVIAGTRRRKAFDRQLPDVLATIASTLRAGHGLRIAMRAVAEDGSPPASEEFSRVLGEERLGRPLHEAVEAMCQRIGSSDLDYVATAINVQSQAGGSLATLFDTLSETVRERQRHARKVRALTSMGRMSALILVCLPFGLAALMTLISPSYMSPFFNTSTGHFLIGFCLVSMGAGGLLLRRIVNVRF
jgi:tight adherence protein B